MPKFARSEVSAVKLRCYNYMAAHGYTLLDVYTSARAWDVAHCCGAWSMLARNEHGAIRTDVTDAHIETVLRQVFPDATFGGGAI